MTEFSTEDLGKILEICSQTTPGPWVSYVEGRDHESGSSFIMTDGEDFEISGATIADQDFIANAKQDIPRLVNEIFRLRRILNIN